MAARMSTQQSLLALKAKREKLENMLREAQSAVVSVEGELRGINHAISLIKGLEQPDIEIEVADIPARRSRGSVKDVVLGLLTEGTNEGLKTIDVVDLAKARGIDLDRNSVASLLSRLHKDGVLSYERESRRYRVPQTAGAQLRTAA